MCSQRTDFQSEDAEWESGKKRARDEGEGDRDEEEGEEGKANGEWRWSEAIRAISPTNRTPFSTLWIRTKSNIFCQ